MDANIHICVTHPKLQNVIRDPVRTSAALLFLRDVGLNFYRVLGIRLTDQWCSLTVYFCQAILILYANFNRTQCCLNTSVSSCRYNHEKLATLNIFWLMNSDEGVRESVGGSWPPSLESERVISAVSLFLKILALGLICFTVLGWKKQFYSLEP